MAATAPATAPTSTPNTSSSRRKSPGSRPRPASTAVAIVGADAGAQTFQVGANNGDTLTITTVAVVTVTGDLLTAANASTALAAIDTRLDTITTNRATYGAALSRFGFAISNLSITAENQSAARGRIMDADFAAETANLARAQILQQAGTAMVAQANQLPQSVLALLRS